MAYSDEELIKAALLTDPDDEEEEKSTQDKQVDDDTADDAGKDQETEDEETDESSEEDDSNSDDTGDKSDEGDASEDEDESGDDDTADDRKPTRRERREERRRQFLESVRKDNAQQPQRTEQSGEPYKPLDYSKDEYDDADLANDREQYAKTQAAQASQAERQAAEQDKFWSELSYEGKLLATDPKLQFLNEANKAEFDPDRTADINERYLELVGYREVPVVNEKGQQLIDPQTRQLLTRPVVARTDISYEKFARAEVARMEAWAERRVAEETKNLDTVRKNAGMRPGGTSRSGLGKLKPGDISKMSDAEFEKYEAEIDRQIAAQLE